MVVSEERQRRDHLCFQQSRRVRACDWGRRRGREGERDLIVQSVVKSISRGSGLQSQSVALKTKSHFLQQRKETLQCEIILRGVALFVLCSLCFGPQLLSAEESKSDEFIKGILGVSNSRDSSDFTSDWWFVHARVGLRVLSLCQHIDFEWQVTCNNSGAMKAVPCSLDTPDESLWNQEVAECSLTPPSLELSGSFDRGHKGPVVCEIL